MAAHVPRPREPYSVRMMPNAIKQLERLPNRIRQNVAARIDALAVDPRPQMAKPLKGTDLWRLRVGDYRILYQIQGQYLLVLIVDIGNRKDVYRGM